MIPKRQFGVNALLCAEENIAPCSGGGGASCSSAAAVGKKAPVAAVGRQGL